MHQYTAQKEHFLTQTSTIQEETRSLSGNDSLRRWRGGRGQEEGTTPQSHSNDSAFQWDITTYHHFPLSKLEFPDEHLVTPVHEMKILLEAMAYPEATIQIVQLHQFKENTNEEFSHGSWQKVEVF